MMLVAKDANVRGQESAVELYQGGKDDKVLVLCNLGGVRRFGGQ